jgi:hypothetical protein
LTLVLLVLAMTAAPAEARTIDFSSNAGLQSTCPPLLAETPKSLRRDEEKVAYAICSGVALAKNVATWWQQNQSAMKLEREDRGRIRIQLEKHLATIARVRSVLESIKSPGPYFVIEPGRWEVDFDGDGHVSVAEKHFFWTPRRGLQMQPTDTARSEAEYQAAYLSPVIKLDRSDILWALAYCNFAEAALNLVLAYDAPDAAVEAIVLVNAERVRAVAYPRLVEGVRVSMKLRESLLAEKDDDSEWIANPRQTRTAFPLVMDEQTFATWGTLLKELEQVLAGRTLLGGRVDAGQLRGLTDLTMGVCPSGQALDVRSLFLRPLKRPLDRRELSARCASPTAALPLSGLAALASESIQRNVGRPTGQDSGEWTILRYLYWVN